MHHPALVDPAQPGGGLHHRVLPAHVVRHQRQGGPLPNRADHVEVGQGRLHHQHVGAFRLVQRGLEERLADVGRSPSGTRAGRRRPARCRPPPGTGRSRRSHTSPRSSGSPTSECPAPSSARRIAATIPSIIPLGATMSAPAVRVGHRDAAQDLEGGVVVDPAVRGGRRSGRGWCTRSSRRRSGAGDPEWRARRRRSARWTMPSSAKFSLPDLVLGCRKAEEQDGGNAERRGSGPTSRSSDSSTERWQTPGIEAISRSTLEPCTTNIGWIRSAASSWCSRTSRRKASVRRRRRGRWIWEVVTVVRLGSRKAIAATTPGHRRPCPHSWLVAGVTTHNYACITASKPRLPRILDPHRAVCGAAGRRSALEARWSRLPMKRLAFPGIAAAGRPGGRRLWRAPSQAGPSAPHQSLDRHRRRHALGRNRPRAGRQRRHRRARRPHPLRRRRRRVPGAAGRPGDRRQGAVPDPRPDRQPRPPALPPERERRRRARPGPARPARAGRDDGARHGQQSRRPCCRGWRGSKPRHGCTRCSSWPAAASSSAASGLSRRRGASSTASRRRSPCSGWAGRRFSSTVATIRTPSSPRRARPAPWASSSTPSSTAPPSAG